VAQAAFDLLSGDPRFDDALSTATYSHSLASFAITVAPFANAMA